VTKKTLTLRPVEERTDAPALQKKGRGWNIAESRLDTLHETAREQRRHPTEAQVQLGEALTAANLGKYRLRRQVVIGSAIVDFACQPLKVAVLIDEAGANPELAHRRDRSLAEVGIKVLRVSAEAVLADAGAVVETIVAQMKAQWEEQRTRSAARRGRPQTAQRGYQR
jgi:very-short-patch-repair endonuclease